MGVKHTAGRAEEMPDEQAEQPSSKVKRCMAETGLGESELAKPKKMPKKKLQVMRPVDVDKTEPKGEQPKDEQRVKQEPEDKQLKVATDTKEPEGEQPKNEQTAKKEHGGEQGMAASTENAPEGERANDASVDRTEPGGEQREAEKERERATDANNERKVPEDEQGRAATTTTGPESSQLVANIEKPAGEQATNASAEHRRADRKESEGEQTAEATTPPPRDRGATTGPPAEEMVWSEVSPAMSGWSSESDS